VDCKVSNVIGHVGSSRGTHVPILTFPYLAVFR
jgi:hypothetical protein